MSGIACLGADQPQVSKRWGSTRPDLWLAEIEGRDLFVQKIIESFDLIIEIELM